MPELATAIGVPALYLKREDLHPFGSHKGRSIPAMIRHYAEQGVRNFVISSSGNAAIAAANALPHGCTLKMFVGKHIDQRKLKQLSAVSSRLSAIRIEQVDNPKQMAFRMDKDGRAKNLRQSTDDAALVGYRSLAEELKKIPNLQAIFIPTSSGTTAQALGQFLPRVQIHIVQTEAVHTMAEVFAADFQKKETSIAGAIVDKVAHRRDAVVAAIKKSGGSGWIVSDDDVRTAIQLVKKVAQIDISQNSALSVAGLTKAVQHGWNFTGGIVCLLTGP